MENTANRGRRGVPLIKTASRLGRRRRIICEGNQGERGGKNNILEGKRKGGEFSALPPPPPRDFSLLICLERRRTLDGEKEGREKVAKSPSAEKEEE